MAYTFGKNEKLCSQKIIDQIYQESQEVKSYPVIIKFIETNEVSTGTVQVGIAVPKKKIKSAVKRNLIKRRIREAYRLNNLSFKKHIHDNKKSIAMFIIYTGDEKISYLQISQKMNQLLMKLKQQL